MKLYSKIYGDGYEDLIIIHGLFGMSDNWNSLGKDFSKYYKVHLVDLRNHGRSPHSEQFDYEVMCEDIIQYIEDHNINKPIILGHSLGGKVAMKLAFTYPQKIERLVVADIAPRKYSTAFHENLLMKLVKLELADFNTRKDLENHLSLYIEDLGTRLFLLKNLYRGDNKSYAWRFNLHVLLEKVSNIQDDSFVEGLCDVSTLFLRGGKSSYINNSDELLINNHFSDFNIVTIDEAGHWLHAEKPHQFFNEVIAFLSA